MSKRFCIPSEKRVYIERKDFAPIGSKFFPFNVNPLFRRGTCVEKQTGSHNSCLPCKNGKNSIKYIQFP